MHTPPFVALLFTVGLIVYLFRRDMRERPDLSGAFWIPLLWLVIIASRTPVQWLALAGVIRGGSMEEGNPLDAAIFFAVIAAGVYVLNKRQVHLGEVVRRNPWLAIFFVYCFIAIFWSEEPFIAFKRWIKIIGHPVMALVLLTEPNPQEAFTRLMKRSAYILIPLSICLIKYYPDFGRGFDQWNGGATNNGITGDKNQLGLICFFLGLFFFWHLLQVWSTERGRARRNELILIAAFLYLIWWLLRKADSATSLVSLLISMVVVALLGLRTVNRRLIGMYAVLAIITLMVAQAMFGILQTVVDFTGHSQTLTGRSELWGELLAFKTNPIIGTGFESFWLGDRLQKLWEQHWWHPTEAHNGYLEIYLNLGILGLLIFAGFIVGAFQKVKVGLLQDFQFGRFRLGFLVAIIVYNWTEAVFRGLSPLWFVFYIIAMEAPSSLFTLNEPGETAEVEAETDMSTALTEVRYPW